MKKLKKKLKLTSQLKKKKKNANQSFNSQIQEIDEKPKSAT